MNIVLIDNYDSFTYNLALLVTHITGRRPVVLKNDCFSPDELAGFDKILLSPGPGMPADAGLLNTVIQYYAASKSILGVCLGHQAIGEVFGATLNNLEQVYHGISTEIIQVQRDCLFSGVPDRFMAGRYHSWVVNKAGLPDTMVVTAEDECGQIMALRHSTFDVRGIQFHPESIMTPYGQTIIANWINN